MLEAYSHEWQQFLSINANFFSDDNDIRVHQTKYKKLGIKALRHRRKRRFCCSTARIARINQYRSYVTKCERKQRRRHRLCAGTRN